MISIGFIDQATLALVSTFLFVFAVVFGLLVYSKVGDFTRRINALIALAIAFFAIMYEPLVVFLTQFMPIAAGVLVVLFFGVLIKKIAGGGGEIKDTFPLIVVLAILLMLLYLFSNNLAALLPAGIDANNVLWGIGIIIVILFFWFIYKYKGGGEGGPTK